MSLRDCSWEPPIEVRTPSCTEVHIWRASLDQPAHRLQQLVSTLSADERRRAAQYCFAADRRRFIVGRGLLRVILSYYPRAAPDHVRFCYGSSGKPALAESGSESKLQFSVAHSRELALYALAYDRSIGIDLEYLRPIADALKIANRFFSVREAAMLRSLPADQRLEAFFHCWTRKEAYLKARGDGLGRPLNQVDVSLISGEPARLLSVHGAPQEAARWSFETLIPAPDYVAALAVEGHARQLTLLQCPQDLPALETIVGLTQLAC